MSNTLLIDGDIVAFHAAAAAQRSIGNPEVDATGCVYAFASLPEGKAIVDNTISNLMSGLNANHMKVAVSGPSAENWRKMVLPSYKSNRDELSRPVLLGHLKEYLFERYPTTSVVGLEADDLLGIWATEANPLPNMRIVVSRDKDMQGIPGHLHTLGDTDHAGNLKVQEISEWQAKRFHLIQALSGDRVDGYGGCPQIGMLRAAKIIDSPVRLVPRDGVITVGKNKGQPTRVWSPEPTNDYWACIVSHYLKAGLTEQDALTTARVAKILLAEDYDMETGTVRLWAPQRINE
jgi:DNA polymerase-1